MATLWQEPSFRRLWIAHAISDAGNAVNRLALPLTAVLVLDAGAVEMGLLVAFQQLPVPLFGLPVGVLLDRVRRRPVMIAADLGRGLLLAAIPVLFFNDALELTHLYVIAAAVGTLTVCFDLAITSHLPELLRGPASDAEQRDARSDLIDANARLQASTAVVSVAGPGVGGVIVAWLGPPLAVGLDALSFLASCAALMRIPRAESRPAPRPHQAFRREIAEGWRMLMGHAVLRAITFSSMFGAAGGAIQQSVLVLFATRELGLGPIALGAVMAGGGLGALLGALCAAPLSRRLGAGRAMILASLVSLLGFAGVLAAGGSLARSVLVLAISQALSGAALGTFSVNQISIRQAVTPDELLGRVNATRRVLVFGVIPVAALAGGLLGDWLGLRAALICSVLATAGALLSALASPLRSHR